MLMMQKVFVRCAVVIAAVAVCSTGTAAKALEGSSAALTMPVAAKVAGRPARGGTGGWMTQGAEILPMGKYAFEARVGFPSTDFGIHVPVAPFFEITPFWTLDYLAYGVWAGGMFGDTFGVQLKGQLWKQGPHAVSLGADLGVALSYIGFNAGVQIGGPDLRYSYRWNNPRIAIIAGFKMPIRVWGITVFAEIPMLFNVGFEYNVIKVLNIHANLEFGPTLLVGAGGGAVVGGHAGFQFGISYLW